MSCRSGIEQSFFRCAVLSSSDRNSCPLQPTRVAGISAQMRSKSWCMEVLLELRRNILDIICVARRLHVVGLIEALVLRTAGSYRLLTIFKYRHITVIMSARWIGFLAGLISFGIFEHDLVHLGRNPCNSYCICFCPNCAAINPLEDRGNSPISQVTLIRIEKTISSARKKYS